MIQFNTVQILSVCLILLVLIGIAFLLSYVSTPKWPEPGAPALAAKPPLGPPVDMEYDAGALVTTENLKFSDFNYEVLMTIGDDKIVIGDPPIATIDMKTGDVELHGKPNDAALTFWEAVEEMKP